MFQSGTTNNGGPVLSPKPGGSGGMSSSGGGALPQPDPALYDLSADPVLQQIIAANQQAIAAAEAAAMAQRKQMLIEYGDPDLAMSLMQDDSTSKAAGGNPYSTKARLKKEYEQGVGGINEALNKQNLFYSSTRGQALGQAADAYGQYSADAAGSLQKALSGVDQGVLQTKEDAASNYTSGLNQAYQNALAFALQYGADPGAGSTAGSPSRSTILAQVRANHPNWSGTRIRARVNARLARS